MFQICMRLQTIPVARLWGFEGFPPEKLFLVLKCCRLLQEGILYSLKDVSVSEENVSGELVRGLGLSPFLPIADCPCAYIMATEPIFSDFFSPSPGTIPPLFASFLPSDLSPAFLPSLSRFRRCFLPLLAV